MNLYIHFYIASELTIMETVEPTKLEVTNISEVRQINEECINKLSSELKEIKLEFSKGISQLSELKKLWEAKEQQIETLMCSLQSYSASIHTAMNRVTSSIDTINNNISNGIPRNGSSNSKSASVSNNNNNSSVSVSSSGTRSTKRAVSINVLFSYVFRLFDGDEVNEAPDLASIIEKYESNNKVNLREDMDLNNLLNEDERAKYFDSLNKLKKESDKTPKKKASLVWGIAKNNKEFHKKFEAFKTHYCESSENKA